MYLKLFLITIVLMAVVFAALGIKMFIKKDGEFKKQCSTVDPQTGKNLGCSCCAFTRRGNTADICRQTFDP